MFLLLSEVTVVDDPMWVDGLGWVCYSLWVGLVWAKENGPTAV